MGWLSRLAGLTEHLKLEVLMEFDIQSGQGGTALRWVVVRPHPGLSDEQCRIALVALLYARTLVNNAETRVELFDRMARAARQVLEGDGRLEFEPWLLHVFRRDFSIWPWTFTEPDRIPTAKTYTATLQSMARGSLAIHLKMALGQDRVLAPSAALIAATALATVLNDSGRVRLARVLLAINAHYQSSGKISLGSEPAALAAAMPVLGEQEDPSQPALPGLKVGGLVAFAGLLAAMSDSASAEQLATTETELLSKADAVRLFSLTKDQWLQEVRRAVARGAAIQTPGYPSLVGMSTTTAEGDLLTVSLDYSQGDARPAFGQVVVGYRPPRVARFDEATVRKILEAAKRQMAPEFDVMGNAERIEGGLAFFFMITRSGAEGAPAPRP